jgi:tetratricopeptide (TPR) repeat protein
LSGLCEAQLKIFTLSYRPQDYAAATSTCSRLMGEDELNSFGFIALGDLNRLSGNYEEAKILYEQALDTDPTAEPALYGIARSVEGLGDYEGANQFYEESVILDPGYWRVYIGYGRYMERGGDFAGAIDQYKQVIKLAPDNQEGYTNLGGAYFDNDQWEEAAEAWEKAVEVDPDAYAYINVGTAEYYRGNYEKAAEYFRTGIFESSELYPLWGKLGAALERLGQTEESQSSFQNAADYAEAAIAVNPKDSRAMYYLASYLAHLGQFDEARAWSAKAVEISPEDPTAFYFTAVVESLGDDEEAAIDALAEALRLGYSVRIIKHGPYFDSFLNSAKLAEWITGDG